MTPLPSRGIVFGRAESSCTRSSYSNPRRYSLDFSLNINLDSTNGVTQRPRQLLHAQQMSAQPASPAVAEHPDDIQQGLDQLKITNSNDAAPSPGPATGATSAPANSTPPILTRDMASPIGSPSMQPPSAAGPRTFGANRLPSAPTSSQPPNGARLGPGMAPAPRLGMPPGSPANGGRPGGPPTRGMPPPLMGMRGRGGPMAGGSSQTKLPPSLQAKMDAASSSLSSNHSFANLDISSVGLQQMARVAKEGSSAANSSNQNDPTSVSSLLASAAARATAPPASASPRPALGGLAARRAAAAASAAGGAGVAGPSAGPGKPGMGLSGMAGAGAPGMNRLRRPGQGLTLSSMGGGAGPGIGSAGAPFSSFKGIVDPSGRLNFQSKAVLHADGVDFSNGQSYKINKDEMELQEELGKGNYGSVQKVYHKPTKVVMAMKVRRKEISRQVDPANVNQVS